MDSVPDKKSLSTPRTSWNKGMKMSLEQRKKMSDSRKGSVPWNKGLRGVQVSWNKGKKLPDAWKNLGDFAKKGAPAWNKGQKGVSEETSRKMSALHKNRSKDSYKNTFTSERTSGERNFNWKGGMMDTQKRYALLRDNFTCQGCNISDREVLEVDHIKPKAVFPELALELSNLVTLCANCHRKKTLADYRAKIFHA